MRLIDGSGNKVMRSPVWVLNEDLNESDLVFRCQASSLHISHHLSISPLPSVCKKNDLNPKRPILRPAARPCKGDALGSHGPFTVEAGPRWKATK